MPDRAGANARIEVTAGVRLPPQGRADAPVPPPVVPAESVSQEGAEPVECPVRAVRGVAVYVHQDAAVAQLLPATFPLIQVGQVAYRRDMFGDLSEGQQNLPVANTDGGWRDVCVDSRWSR